MAMLSVSGLLDWLVRNQFLTSAQADELRPGLPGLSETRLFVKDLIQRDWLTPYQGNQIVNGLHDQLVFGIYRLRELIGEGAMGQVFKAWNTKQNRVVAIKAILKSMLNNERAMDRFRREVETASQFDHPNICHVRDHGEIDGRPYLAMEFIDGIDLAKRVKLDGALPIHEAVEYIRQAALGLQYAFEQSIVHRDIKPANLMVSTIRYNDDALPVVKILDFGLARLQTEDDEGEGRLTQVGRLLGTIDYIAPEQATDARNADIRADIYSLGCSLYYLLTAQPPFQGNDVMEKLGPRVTGDPPWIRTLRPDVPPGLEMVLRTMMARKPADRYQTPAEAAQALAPFAKPGVALATPVAKQTNGAVALATPVVLPGAASSGDTVETALPVALPVATPAPPPSASASTDAPSFPSLETAVPPDAKARGPGPKPFPTRLVALAVGAIGLIALGVLAFCLFSSFWKDPPRPQGTIRITEAWVQKPKVRPGDRTFVNIIIERQQVKGDLKITLLDLPDGAVAEEKVISDNIDKIWVGLTVSFETKPIATQIRIRVATLANDVFAERTIPLIIANDTKKTK